MTPTRPFHRLTPSMVCAVAALVLVACGDPAGTSPDAEPAPEDAAPDASDEAAYSCFGPPYPESAWAATEPVEDLDHPALDELRANVPDGDLSGWFVLEAAESHLAVAREHTEPSPEGDSIHRTHDVVAVEHLDDDGWMLMQWSSCAPQLVLDGLGGADVWLAAEPDPSSTTLDLVVNELACAGGTDAADRVEVVSLIEGTHAVEIVIGVETLDGDQTCPGNPLTPVTVELVSPLGDRDVIDASIYPAAPMQPHPADAREGGTG